MEKSRGWYTFLAWFSAIATFMNVYQLWTGTADNPKFTLVLLCITAYFTGYWFNEINVFKNNE